jgi:hypothetical protein
VAGIRAAYQSGRLRLIEKTKLEGREVYRLEVVPRQSMAASAKRAAPVDLFVDASTFIPIEDINFARGPHGQLVPSFVIHYRTFEELPATPQNLAALNMAPHLGARVILRH